MVVFWKWEKARKKRKKRHKRKEKEVVCHSWTIAGLSTFYVIGKKPGSWVTFELLKSILEVL